MNKLAELRKKLVALKGKATAMLDVADREARDFTAEEQTAYDAVKAEITATQGQIEVAERLAEERRTMEAVTGTAGAYGAYEVREPNPETTGGFKSMAEFAVAVRQASARNGEIDRRLLATPSNVHQGGASTGEGYEVPPQYRDAIFEIATEVDDLAAMVDEEPTEKREVKAIADETTPWAATGVQAYWRSEGSQMTASKLSTTPRSIPLHELYAFVLATDELLEDGPRLANRITRRAGEAIAWKRAASIFYGSGVGQPLGWMNSAALVSVAKESGQAADTINATNAIKMFSRLLRIPGDNPVWFTNSDCLPQLMTMTVGDKPIWMPPNGLVDAPGGFLLGAPVRLTEHAKTVGDLGDLQLVSPKGYHALRRESGPKFAQSMHLYFDYAIEAFRWTFRFGGQPHLSAPVSPANGSNTKSHFVALAERA